MIIQESLLLENKRHRKWASFPKETLSESTNSRPRTKIILDGAHRCAQIKYSHRLVRSPSETAKVILKKYFPLSEAFLCKFCAHKEAPLG